MALLHTYLDTCWRCSEEPVLNVATSTLCDAWWFSDVLSIDYRCKLLLPCVQIKLGNRQWKQRKSTNMETQKQASTAPPRSTHDSVLKFGPVFEIAYDHCLRDRDCSARHPSPFSLRSMCPMLVAERSFHVRVVSKLLPLTFDVLYVLHLKIFIVCRARHNMII